MAGTPHSWKTPGEAKARAEELQIALDQLQRKEITPKQAIEILRPEIEARLQATPSAGTMAESIEAFIKDRLKSDPQLYTMLRTCLNDAESAAGMWDRKSKPEKR